MGLYGGGLGLGGPAYLAVLCGAFLAYLAVVASADALGTRRVWGAIAILVAAFAFAPPLLSLDVFSYISYARLGAEHGLNPYASAPADLPADPAAARVDDWRFAASVYGPAFTLGTYPLGLAGAPVALWSLKGVFALALVGVAALAGRIAAARGGSPSAAAALVALNPVILVHLVGGAHNDALMALLVMATAAAVVWGHDFGAGAAAVGAAAVKASGVLILPFAVAGSARRGRILAGIALLGALVGAATLVAFGTQALESLWAVGSNQAQTSDYSVPSALARALGLGIDPLRVAFAAAYAGLAIGLLVWAARGGDWLRAVGWAALGLLVTTAWMVPWYLIWVLPLAAVARDRALTAAVLALSAFQLPNAIPL